MSKRFPSIFASFNKNIFNQSKMQQNTDFIEPKNFSSSPIKKTFDYYNTQGNLWDSKYLSSKKISKYYLDPQEFYLSGPMSPRNISLIESTERSRAYNEKAIKNKLQCRQRLKERIKEREFVVFI